MRPASQPAIAPTISQTINSAIMIPSDFRMATKATALVL
jgi:hypothetical protein